MSLLDRLQHSWNAFMNKDPTQYYKKNMGSSYSVRPDRPRFTRGNERSIVTAVYNRMAIDAAATTIRHVRLDKNDRFIEVIDSGLNSCLNLEANKDQTGRAFMQDVYMSMFDEGCVAMVPTDTDIDIKNNTFDIDTIRTGQIVEWFPEFIKVRVYNEAKGVKEDIVVPKKSVAIIENPFYAVMNEQNSTMQRLIRKLNLLDSIDEQSGAGKLDLIIQLPYIIKSEARRQQAEERRKQIEEQLAGSKYGIAYADGTEKIIQLNRSLENNLMKQIEYLTSMLYSQLGLTQEIMDGTADEKVMNNYLNRTIEPILSNTVDEMKRKFLTKTARTQKQSIIYFRDPFKLVPVSQIAEMADKFTRNEILSSNEFRQILGLPPINDPKADELRNKNLNASDGQEFATTNPDGAEEIQNEGEMASEQDIADLEADKANLSNLNDVNALLDELLQDLQHDGMSGDFFKHYASPYYDPVKAHEYYMEYVKKNRTKGTSGTGDPYTTAKLNDQGKMAYKQIKEKLKEEKDSTINKSRESTNAQIKSSSEATKNQVKAEQESTKAEIEAEKAKTKAEIERVSNEIAGKIDEIKKNIKTLRETNPNAIAALQDKILAMQDEGSRKKATLQEENKRKTESLRSEQKSKVAGIREGHKALSTSLRSAHKETSNKAREDYKTKARDELVKMIDSGEFKKVSKKRGRKK